MRQGSRDHLASAELIHQLNQRYRDEFDRAERLRAELADIQGSRLWPLFSWARNLRKSLRHRSHCIKSARVWHQCLTLTSRSKAETDQVSIIIPFRDQLELLRECLAALKETAAAAEIVLVDNGSRDPRVHAFLATWQSVKCRVISLAEPFNFSRLCNAGAAVASGAYLLFLNNDVMAWQENWLSQMLQVAADDRVGIVGATLVYPDRTLQHAGIAPAGPGDAWVHLYRGMPEIEPGAHGELRQIRTVPAVTGACLLISRMLFQELGGFDERLAVTFNDVDLCLRARQSGKLVTITPFARLLHWESLSRGYLREAG